jgi:hypothetical protein
MSQFQVFGAFAAIALLAPAGCGSAIDRNAQSQFHKSLPAASITVFPAVRRQGQTITYDAAAARTIAAALTAEKVASASAGDVEVKITGPWHMDQSRMWRESATEFAEFIKANPIQTEYAALPEYLLSPRAAVGVHIYIVDAQGRIAEGFLLNSHHAAFSKADPKSADDCTQLLVQVIKDAWHSGTRGK